jgi:replicative superfamily II helicase
MFIKTTVTLEDGKRLEAYYLDKEGMEQLYQLRGHVQNIFYRLESMEKQLDAMKRLLKPELKRKLELKFLSHLADFRTDRSYRDQDFGLSFRKKLDLPWQLGDLVNEVFDQLINDGAIEARGSGWYRNKISIK